MTSGHPWPADVCYSIGTALLLWRFWTWEDLSNHRYKSVIQFGSGALLIAALAAMVRWDHSMNPTSPPFHILQGTTFKNVPLPTAGQAGAFDLLYSIPANKFVLVPISMLAFITITNTSQIPQSIAGLSAESKGSFWSWHRMCRLAIKGSKFFFVYGSQASELGTENFAENLIAGKTIAPGQSVGGWLPILCSNEESCGSNGLRIRVLLASGDKYDEEIPLKHDVPDLADINLHVLPGKPIDLSALKPTISYRSVLESPGCDFDVAR